MSSAYVINMEFLHTDVLFLTAKKLKESNNIQRGKIKQISILGFKILYPWNFYALGKFLRRIK